MTAGRAVAALVLLGANAFFVAAEFAVIASRRTRLEELAETSGRRGRAALDAVRELSLQLAGAQLGITMASLGLGYVAEPLVADAIEGWLEHLSFVPEAALHPIAFGIALLLVVFVHMVFGEMVPKNVAIAEPERTLLWLAVPGNLYVRVLRPVITGLNALANLGVRLLGKEPTDELLDGYDAEALAALVHESRAEGLLDDEEGNLLVAALAFGRRDVDDLMVPRDRVRVVQSYATVAEVERQALASDHSRLPVVVGDLDDCLGFVHVKDLLVRGDLDTGDRLPDDLLRPLLRISSGTPLEEVLVSMRNRRVHLALVLAGPRVLGIVTLEDLATALVGDLRARQEG